MAQVEISDHDLFELSALVYRKWSEAYDNLKKVKAEKPDYKREPDWDAFHALRLKNATEEEAKLKAFLDRMVAISPKINL